MKASAAFLIDTVKWKSRKSAALKKFVCWKIYSLIYFLYETKSVKNIENTNKTLIRIFMYIFSLNRIIKKINEEVMILVFIINGFVGLHWNLVCPLRSIKNTKYATKEPIKNSILGIRDISSSRINSKDAVMLFIANMIKMWIII